MPNHTVPLRGSSLSLSVLRYAILGTFPGLLLGTIAWQSARADDSHWEGEPFVGMADGIDNVTATLQPADNTIVVVKKDAPCDLHYFLMARTKEHPLPGKQTDISSCQVVLCTNPDLRKKCKSLGETYTTTCTGKLNYQTTEQMQLQIEYKAEDWDKIKCTHHADKQKTFTAVVLKKQPRRDSKSASDGLHEQVDCAARGILYFPGDHPLGKGQCP